MSPLRRALFGRPLSAALTPERRARLASVTQDVSPAETHPQMHVPPPHLRPARTRAPTSTPLGTAVGIPGRASTLVVAKAPAKAASTTAVAPPGASSAVVAFARPGASGRSLTELDIPALTGRVYALLVERIEREKRSRGR